MQCNGRQQVEETVTICGGTQRQRSALYPWRRYAVSESVELKCTTCRVKSCSCVCVLVHAGSCLISEGIIMCHHQYHARVTQLACHLSPYS